MGHRSYEYEGYTSERTRRADWPFGYGSRSDIASFFVAVEAKRPEKFSTAEAQLLTYLVFFSVFLSVAVLIQSSDYP